MDSYFLETPQSVAVQQAYEDAKSEQPPWAFWRRKPADLEAGNGTFINVEPRFDEIIYASPAGSIDGNAIEASTAFPNQPNDGAENVKPPEKHMVESKDWKTMSREKKYEYTSKDVISSGMPYVFYPIMRLGQRDKPKKFVLNIAALQAYSIRLCQAQVVEVAKDLREGNVNRLLPERIHRYCDALRDMDYMQEKARNGFDHDPFLLSTSKHDERRIMQNFGLLPPDVETILPRAEDYDRPILPGVGRTARIHAAERKARLYNLLSALFGVLALLIPMVIMKLFPTRVCVLVTTCGFVLGFAFAIALGSNLKSNEILGVTAAYAAVLVVFVGSTT